MDEDNCKGVALDACSYYFFLIFIYLAALGLSCSTQALHCGAQASL